MGGKRQYLDPGWEENLNVTNNFTISVWVKPDMEGTVLRSLHRHDQEGVKYFSGVATYVKSFHIPALFLFLIQTAKSNQSGAASFLMPPGYFVSSLTTCTGPSSPEGNSADCAL